jgi:glycosyltransferase involved in cell wall biosynthesis
MSNSPLVSIIAVCYNHEKYVVETLDSILSQTYANIQLIIMDDCSTDNSVQVIQDWINTKNVECIFIPHEKNNGLCKTLNEALKYVDGEYYQAISCDDILMWDKITLQMQVFEEYPDIAVVSSNVIEIDSEGNVLAQSDSIVNNKNGLRKSKTLFKILLEKNIIEAPTVLVRKSVIPKINPYDEQLIFEDWDLWLKLSLEHDFFIIEEPLVKYRILSTSMSSSLKDSHRKIKDIILILSKYKGLWLETDQIINGQLKGLNRKLYHYSFSAVFSGETPVFEYFIKLKMILRFNSRVKNLKERINKSRL